MDLLSCWVLHTDALMQATLNGASPDSTQQQQQRLAEDVPAAARPASAKPEPPDITGDASHQVLIPSPSARMSATTLQAARRQTEQIAIVLSHANTGVASPRSKPGSPHLQLCAQHRSNGVATRALDLAVPSQLQTEASQSTTDAVGAVQGHSREVGLAHCYGLLDPQDAHKPAVRLETGNASAAKEQDKRIASYTPYAADSSPQQVCSWEIVWIRFALLLRRSACMTCTSYVRIP